MDSMTEAQYTPTDNQSYPGETDVLGAPIETQIDQEIVNMVVGRQKSSEDWRKNWRLEWDRATDHYEQIYDASNKEPWQATTFQPMTPTYVERGTASLHNMSMGPEIPVEFKPRNSQDEKQVNDINDIIQHDLERGNFKVHWTDFLRNLCLYGTGIGKVSYEKKSETVMIKNRPKPMTQMFGGMLSSLQSFFGVQAQQGDSFTPKKVITKDWAIFKSCDIYNIYPQPYIEDFTKDTWVIEKFKITNKELIDGAMNEDPYYRLENITPELLMSSQIRPNSDPETQQKKMAMGDQDVPMPYMEPDAEHEAFEYWGPVPKWFLQPELRNDDVQKYQTVNAWIWVIDGQWVVRKRLTPIMDGTPPYVKGNYIRRPGEFYGIGVGKLLDGLQVEKNEIRNTRQDNIELILNKIVALAKDRIAKGEANRLISAPGQIWPFSGIDDIKKVVTTIDFPDITADSWRGSAEVDREAQEVTDIVKTTQTIGAGEDQAGNGTFRGQLLNKQQANERFMLYARILEIMGLNMAIEKIYQRIYQFKDYEQIKNILGEVRYQTFEMLEPSQLMEKAALVSLGALTTENKGIKLAQMRDFYVLASQEPFFKKLDYLRKMYRLMGTGSDPDEILWTDDEVKTFNDIKRKMIQGAGGLDIGGDQPSPSGLGTPTSGPVAGGQPGPTDGLPRPSLPAVGPGNASDVIGRPAA